MYLQTVLSRNTQNSVFEVANRIGRKQGDLLSSLYICVSAASEAKKLINIWLSKELEDPRNQHKIFPPQYLYIHELEGARPLRLAALEGVACLPR